MTIKIKNSQHIHKLKRHRYKTGSTIYFCVNDCNFRMSIELALGKVVECWRCGRPFSMNKYAITLDRPHCEQCHKHKTDEQVRKGRRKNDKPIPQANALEAVSELSGENLVNDLKGRLDSALSDSIIRLDSISEPELAKEETKTVEIKEFKLDEEEFL